MNENDENDTTRPTYARAAFPVYDALPAKQRRFVDAYCGAANSNATEAARVAGYGGGAAGLATNGWRLLQKPAVMEAVRERYAGAAMESGETLARLAILARATLADCYADGVAVEWDFHGEPACYNAETGEPIGTKPVKVFSIERAFETGAIHCIQRIRPTRHGFTVEMHDTQAALDKIARALGLYQSDGGTAVVIFKDLRGVDLARV